LCSSGHAFDEMKKGIKEEKGRTAGKTTRPRSKRRKMKE
jgi:hypothetical protein